MRGLINRHRRGRRRGFKTDTEKNHLLCRILFGKPHGIERRINNAHVAAPGFDRKQIRRAAGHAQHVAERRENDVGPRGDIKRLVYDFERRHADRATGAVDECNLLGQQFINAELHDGVRLAAANLHDVPGPRRDAVHFARNLLREFTVTVFVEKFHVLFGGARQLTSRLARTPAPLV